MPIAGHIAAAAAIANELGSPTRPPLHVLTGPSGIGLSSTLASIAEILDSRGIRTHNLSFASSSLSFGPRIPLANALIDQAGTDGLVLLIDDAEGMDVEAIGQLHLLVRKLAGTKVACVCAFHLPARTGLEQAARAGFAELRAAGLATLTIVRPLSGRQISGLVTTMIQAKPEPGLVTHLRRITRGRPGALLPTLSTYERTAAIQVVDRHAYLRPGQFAPYLSENEEILLAVRRMGASAWSVGKAMSMLNPLDAAAVPLTAQALGIAERTVLDNLDQLAEHGVVRRLPSRSAWRFRVPLLEYTLRSRLGPYERRLLAQLAVTALWTTRARTSDPFYLADQLANVGRMIGDRSRLDRARVELLAAADRFGAQDPARLDTWLRATITLTPDRGQRAGILARHAAMSLVNGQFQQSLDSWENLLADHADVLTPEMFLDGCLIHLSALLANGEFGAPGKIADGTCWPWSDEEQMCRVIAQVASYCLLGRWQEARKLVADTEDVWSGNASASYYARIYDSLAALWLGEPQQFEDGLATLSEWRDSELHHQVQVTTHLNALLTLGELDRAERLLAADNRAESSLGETERALLAAQRGQGDVALELTRKSIVTGPPQASDPSRVMMYQMAAVILAVRGKLSRARDLLADARAKHPVTAFVLARPDAMIDWMIGDPEQARNKLKAALAEAERSRTVANTDLLWLESADLAVAQGRRDQLSHLAQRAADVAGKMGTGRAVLHSLMLRAAADCDQGVAEQALKLARQRAQPLELAGAIDRLVRYGVLAPATLAEAYELLGGLDALLYRAWMRNLMRTHGVAVPGRQATVAENERLLAVLVAEGLGNRQIAVALQATEKSVEGRLTRLFSRTGYRSRIELAAAMLSDEFDHH
jgi:DNA-binding NarL/FixJ family response regulator